MKPDDGCPVHKTLGIVFTHKQSPALLRPAEISAFQIFLRVCKDVEIAWRQVWVEGKVLQYFSPELWSLCDFQIFGDLYPESAMFNDSVGPYIVCCVDIICSVQRQRNDTELSLEVTESNTDGEFER